MTILDAFTKNSVLKILAMAEMDRTEYKIVLYLMNCNISGFSQIITSHQELSDTLGLKTAEIQKSLDHLFNLRMIHFKVRQNQTYEEGDSFALSLNAQIEKWKINEVEESSDGAVIFPFQRVGEHLHLVDSPSDAVVELDATIMRVLGSFSRFHESDKDITDEKTEQQAARLLCETHSVDQVLLFIQHFKERIPSLSLLASSWQHYLDLYEQENQNIDFSKLRSEHAAKDKKVKQAALKLLDGKEIPITSEEREVLTIIFQHRHPRRQLFWAYQSRSRYKNLKQFFYGPRETDVICDDFRESCQETRLTC